MTTKRDHDAEPTISFVLPTKNSMPHLENAIEAVFQQTYDRWELIIQDGASTDGTLDFLKGCEQSPYGDRIHLQSSPDSGIGQAYNRGLQRSKGDLIWFLASDETLYPHAANDIVSLYAQHPNAATIYGGMELIDENGALISTFIPPPFNLLRFMHCEIFPCTSGIINKRVLGSDLYYDETLATCPDYDFWLRLGQNFSPEAIISTGDVWMRALGTRSSMSYRVESFDQFCRDKISTLDKFLKPLIEHRITRDLRDSAAAGIFCWAAECVYNLTGISGQFLAYVSCAFHMDSGSPRLLRLLRLINNTEASNTEKYFNIRDVDRIQYPSPQGNAISKEEFDISLFTTYDHWIGASLIQSGKNVQIITSPDQWSYSGFLPLSNLIHVSGDWFWIRLSVRVKVGSVGVSVLCRGESSDILIDEQNISSSGSWRDVYLHLGLADLPRVEGIMVRNSGLAGKSTVEIREATFLASTRQSELQDIEERIARLSDVAQPLIRRQSVRKE